MSDVTDAASNVRIVFVTRTEQMESQAGPLPLPTLDSKLGPLDVQYRAAAVAAPQQQPQHKRMKKRKELNALIGLTADGKKKKPSSSGHQLLLRPEAAASDSESTSEYDEFPQSATGSSFVKGGFMKCCKICYPLCAFVLLVACVVACIGLVWMQVALKEDLDALKEKFRTFDSSQKSSLSGVPRLNEEVLSVQKGLANLDTGDRGINKIWSNLTELNNQISQLNAAVAHLKANVKSAADLINLPLTVEELQKSVATIGSTLTSVQHDVDTIQTSLESQKKIVATLQQNEDILFLRDAIEDVNSSLVQYHAHNDQRLRQIDHAVSNLTQRVSLLGGTVPGLGNATKMEIINGTAMGHGNSSQEVSSTDLTDSTKISTSSENSADRKASELRQRLRVMVNALTNKPDHIGSPNALNTSDAKSTAPTVKPSVTPSGAGKKTDRRSVKLKHVSLPGITTLQALQALFLQSADGQLSYQDLQAVFGPQIPSLNSLKQFDIDGNGRFSQTELLAAVGL
uniref:EF-hand domain-containing protein n=1 Tax=Callorhinchus milii TaxID=7868 RepID=V9KLU3_CALMI|eukprot:gi/632986177/ref/XP_007910089.1/ PREDICTED: EF-hand calcium-binding domain-containing protein 14 [Callorhinchus milii]